MWSWFFSEYLQFGNWRCWRKCVSLHSEVLSPAVVTVSESGQTSVRVSWGPLQPDTVTSYLIEYSALPGGKLQTVRVDPRQNSTLLRGLQADTTYLVTVSARHASGKEKAMSVKMCTQEGEQWDFNGPWSVYLTLIKHRQGEVALSCKGATDGPSLLDLRSMLRLIALGLLLQLLRPWRTSSWPLWEVIRCRWTGRPAHRAWGVTGSPGRDSRALYLAGTPPSICHLTPGQQGSRTSPRPPGCVCRPFTKAHVEMDCAARHSFRQVSRVA